MKWDERKQGNNLESYMPVILVLFKSTCICVWHVLMNMVYYLDDYDSNTVCP